jgi:hypothetical protein
MAGRHCLTAAPGRREGQPFGALTGGLTPLPLIGTYAHDSRQMRTLPCGPVGFRLIALDHVLQLLWEDDGSACRAIVLDGVEIL